MVMIGSTLTPLAPKVIENVFLMNLQGQMVATGFLPERQISYPVFEYRRYGELGGMTPKSQEGSATRTSSTEYSTEKAACIEYREGEMVTEQAIKFYKNIRDHQLDAAEHLSMRMILRQEYNTIITLQNNAGSELDLTLGTGVSWNEPNCDPLDDLTEVRRIIRKEGHITPDVTLINADTEADLLQTAALKQWQLSGPISQNPLTSGSLDGTVLRGTRFVVTDAFYLSDSAGVPRDTAAVSNEIKNYLIDNAAVVFKAGGDLGFTYVAEPYTNRTFPIEDRRSLKMMVWKTMVPVIFRPQFICTISNIRTDES